WLAAIAPRTSGCTGRGRTLRRSAVPRGHSGAAEMMRRRFSVGNGDTGRGRAMLMLFCGPIRRAHRLIRRGLGEAIRLVAAAEIGRSRGHCRAGIAGRGRDKLRQSSSDIKMSRLSKLDGVHLARRKQTSQDFAHLAARGQRREKELYFFHAGGDDGLEINGGEHRDRRNLRSGCTLSDSFLKARAQQLPTRGGAGRRNHRKNTELLPKLCNCAKDSGFTHFPTQRVLELRNGRLAAFEKLVSLNG